MHRINKINKRGFTLIEMMMVVALIIVLASVLFIAVGDIYNRAKSANDTVEASRTELVNGRNASERSLAAYHF